MMIRWWVELWDRREVPTVLALVRIGVGAVLLGDVLTVWGFDLVDALWVDVDYGGLSAAGHSGAPPWWIRWVGADPASAQLLLVLLLLTSTGLMLGIATPVSAALLLLLYAQTALILPLSDRAIDTLLRNVLLILVFARSGAVWSFDAWLRTGRLRGTDEALPAWPRYLLVLQLVVMYFTAGVQKYAQHWWPWGGFSALYVILNDWSYARQDFSWTARSPFYGLTQLGTAVTLFFQITYPVVLLHYFPPSTSPGRVRRLLERTQLHWLWIGVGALFHLGIALTLRLGIFPWGMLVLYPAYLHPNELARLFRWIGAGATGSRPA